MGHRSTAIFVLNVGAKNLQGSQALTNPPPTAWLPVGYQGPPIRIRDKSEMSVKVEAVLNAIEKKGRQSHHQGPQERI